jgi:hypothetical protein
MFPAITAGQIFTIMGGCAVVAVAIGGVAVARGRPAARASAGLPGSRAPVDKLSWRMPPLSELPAPAIAGARRIGLIGLRAYLAIAMVMVIVKIVLLATGH